MLALGVNRWKGAFIVEEIAYLAYTVDKGPLVHDIHRFCLKERACSLNSDSTGFHLLAGFFDHLNAISNIASKSNKHTVGP